VCGGNYVLQNPGRGRKSREIARLEHINGDEPYSTLWTRAHKVENAYVESFNGKFRDECLNEHWFVSLADAKAAIEAWRLDYNGVRPHSSLDGATQDQFARISEGARRLTQARPDQEDEDRKPEDPIPVADFGAGQNE